jgi:Homing endonuclease associated repeat
MLKSLKCEFDRLESFKRKVDEEKRNKKQFPHHRVLTDHLGISWAELTKACECKEIKEVMTDVVRDEDLINEYKKLSKKMGRPATVKYIKEHSTFTYDIYSQHFGTIGRIRKASGFSEEEVKQGRPIITKEECFRELRMLHNEYGKLSYNELRQKSSISVTTIFRKFNSTKSYEIWDEALNDET